MPLDIYTEILNLIDNFHEEHKEVGVSLVCFSDGRPVASSSRRMDDQSIQMSAAVAAIQSMVEKTITNFVNLPPEEIRRVVVEGENDYFIIVRSGKSSILATYVASTTPKLHSILASMTRASWRIGRILDKFKPQYPLE